MDRQIAFNPDKNQNSQGGLITLNSGKKEQDSRGGLKHGQDARFVSNRPIIAELNKQEIQAFQIIPDYDSSTFSPYPVIVKSPTSCHCIDGWDKVESSIAQNQSTLTCHVFYIPEFSETEIAIRKVAIRTMPLGGTCSYTELVRNASILFNMFLASAENPVVFSHGGARRGSAHTGNRGDDIRALLAERLGKSITTINKYLNHCEYLSEITMDEILTSGEGKKFFEEAQRNKRILIRNMKSDGNSDQEIAIEISKQMLSWLKEYQSTGKIITDFGVEEDSESPDDENFTANRIVMKKQAEFNPWLGNSETDDDGRLTFEGIKDEYKAICELGIKDTEGQESDLNKLKSSVKTSFKKLALVLKNIKALQIQENSNADKETK